MFKKNEIFIFSSLSDDATLDSIKSIKRINFTPEFLQFDFKIDDFKNSLVIVDDIDNCTNKLLKTKLLKTKGATLVQVAFIPLIYVQKATKPN